jgi:hypothetical protein
MATESYIVTSVSAGRSLDDKGNPIVWANVELLNVRGKSTGRNGTIAYGSPRIKVNLVNEETGEPNVELAQKLERAGVYGKAVTFEGAYDVIKQRGEEKLSFVIFDAHLDYSVAKE